MVVIEVHNSRCKLVTADRAIIALIDDAFSVYVDGYFFSPLFNKRMWDGKFHAFSRLTGVFKIGLLVPVCEELRKHKIEYLIEEKRVKPVSSGEIQPQLLFLESEGFRELRDYQNAGVGVMHKHSYGVIKAATNAGKTEMFCEFLRMVGLRAIVICTRKELFHQTATRLETRLGVPIGKVGDGCRQVQDITVVMPATAVKSVLVKGNKNKTLRVSDEFAVLLTYDVLILDECQNLGDSRVTYLVEHSEAYYRFAFSGTPFMKDKADNLRLRSNFGSIIVDINNQQLIEQGVSSVPYCFFIPEVCDDLVGLPYEVSYSVGIVQNQHRNQVAAQLANTLTERQLNVLIVCARVEHVNMLRLELPDAEVSHGDCSSAHRTDVLARFKQGEIKQLIVTSIWDEGIDTDQIDVIIMVAGMMTPEKILQRVGRGLRRKESMRFLYFDWLDSSNAYLADHSAKRIATLKAEGFKVRLLKCEDISEVESWI